MQVNLKQTEIEVALKNFIAQQGISLCGKDVSIAFTAGRKESGISAEITIEDTDIPGFEEADAQVPAFLMNTANVVNTVPAVEVPAEVEPTVTIVHEDLSQAYKVHKVDPEAVVAAAAEEQPVKTTSLFD